MHPVIAQRFSGSTERASSHQSKSRVPWLTNPPEQTYWQCTLLCCVVLCCVVLCSIVLYSAVLCSIVLSRKAFISHLHTNIERHFWGLPVASPMTPSPWKYFFWHNLGRSFHTCCQIEAILKTAKFFKLTKIWGPGELFHQKFHRKYVILTG